ncbi:hypothetical protein [Micavibrio aeruginosavorus]|uniref:hypothetical protein n=1 Tax=Micavibrio aeruginosavorus TaxID=349221 RepID=UPI003F4ADEEE
MEKDEKDQSPAPASPPVSTGPLQMPISPSGNVTLQFEESQVSVGPKGDGVRVGLNGDNAPEVFYQRGGADGKLAQGGVLIGTTGDFNSSISLSNDPFEHHAESETLVGARLSDETFLGRAFRASATAGVTVDGTAHASANIRKTHDDFLGVDAAVASSAAQVSLTEKDGVRVDVREGAQYQFKTPWDTKAEATVAAQATFSERRGTSYTASTDLDVRLGKEGRMEKLSAVFGASAGSEGVGARAGVYHDVGPGRAGLEVEQNKDHGTTVGFAIKAGF